MDHVPESQRAEFRALLEEVAFLRSKREQFDRELSSANAAFNARLQAIQSQLKEEKESYELKLMMTASDAMERDNKNERQLKELSKKNEELNQKISMLTQASAATSVPKVSSTATPTTEAYEGQDGGTTSSTLSMRQQLPVVGFSQKNLLKSIPQAPQLKRPRSDHLQQPVQQNLRGSSVPQTLNDTAFAPRSQAQVSMVASTPGTPDTCTPSSIETIRDLARLGTNASQNCSASLELRFIEQCLHNGPASPFKQLSQALNESGALGESDALMHGAELLSSLVADSLSGCSCVKTFSEALFAWSLCSFLPVCRPALRCFVILSSIAPRVVLSHLLVPSTVDKEEDKSNPPSCKPLVSLFEAVDFVVKRDSDASSMTISMQLVTNIIPACSFDEANLVLETYLRRKQVLIPHASQVAHGSRHPFCILGNIKLGNCLASRRPLLIAALRNTCKFRLSDDPIIQICKGFGYGRTDETRHCQMCPHESPYSSHADFACSIRIEAVRTMSRMCRFSVVLEPGCELTVTDACAADTSDASEYAIFRDIPALLVTMLAKELHDMDTCTSRPSHWNCVLVEEALIFLLRLNSMLQSSIFSATQKDIPQNLLPLMMMHANRIIDAHRDAHKASTAPKYPAMLVDSMRLLLATNFG